ncbi:hypothetical protein AMECASPLE_007382 [Ameca splendens]|uniref:Uncharacterized protein n=1 Tax=Ameca splendens TaxID=208324 RepID=A0ABV0Y016_9TELE
MLPFYEAFTLIVYYMHSCPEKKASAESNEVICERASKCGCCYILNTRGQMIPARHHQSLLTELQRDLWD